jgi:hypothetical protein
MTEQKQKKGQSAVEYLILATTVTIVILVGFDQDRGLLMMARNLSEGMINQSLRGIMGTNSLVAARKGAANYP